MSSGDDDDFNPFRDESSEDDEDGEQVTDLEYVKNSSEMACHTWFLLAPFAAVAAPKSLQVPI